MNDDGLIREVNEAVRQEQWQNAFRTFGKYILAITGLIIFSTIAYVWWQASVEKKNQLATEQLYDAILMVEDGKSYQAREAFDALADSDVESIALLADLWRVKLKSISGKDKETVELAEQIHQEIANQTDYIPYRDLLKLYLPITPEMTGQGAYRLTQTERLAIDRIREGKLKEAGELYTRIANDSQTPSTMRERAKLILSTYLHHELPAPSDKAASALTGNETHTDASAADNVTSDTTSQATVSTSPDAANP